MSVKLTFGEISRDELLDYFKVFEKVDYELNIKNIEVSKDIEEDLISLISKNREYLDDYLEEELKMLFIAPFLNFIDFQCSSSFRAWFERDLSFKFDNITLSGKPDFMLASGRYKPEKPFFFIQEYKKSLPEKNAKWQLVAELITAIEQSETEEMLGAYVFGRYWYFTKLLKKDKEYFLSISESYDSLKINDLKTIYKNLQAIKSLYCNENKK